MKKKTKIGDKHHRPDWPNLRARAAGFEFLAAPREARKFFGIIFPFLGRVFTFGPYLERPDRCSERSNVFKKDLL